MNPDQHTLVLAKIREQADAATEGPWSWGALPTVDGDEWAVFSPEDWALATNRDGRVADAEFIAAARTTVPALVSALEKVLAMHTPKNNGRVSMCCSCEQWIESSDDEACIEYPCPTVTAIITALEGLHHD